MKKKLDQIVVKGGGQVYKCLASFLAVFGENNSGLGIRFMCQSETVLHDFF